MKTKTFFELLESNSSKSLNFEYSPGKKIKPGYHLTEVKHHTINSVDCGSRTDQWAETIVQLWENPLEPKSSENMSALKARGILKKVGKLYPFQEDAVLKFEYGNSSFHTAQLLVHSYEISENELVIKLHPDQTDCKAKTECGVEQLLNAVEEEACCSPESGCC